MGPPASLIKHVLAFRPFVRLRRAGARTPPCRAVEPDGVVFARPGGLDDLCAVDSGDRPRAAHHRRACAIHLCRLSLAYAVSMLVLGPLSDSIGRRRTLLWGLGLSMASSLACAAAPTVAVLIAARVLQGVGACAGMVVGRALTREIWGAEASAQVIAGRSMAATLMQAFAPVLGGYVQAWLAG